MSGLQRLTRGWVRRNDPSQGTGRITRGWVEYAEVVPPTPKPEPSAGKRAKFPILIQPFKEDFMVEGSLRYEDILLNPMILGSVSFEFLEQMMLLGSLGINEKSTFNMLGSLKIEEKIKILLEGESEISKELLLLLLEDT